MNIEWVKIEEEELENIPWKPQVLLIAVPTWTAAGKWKGYYMDTAFFDGLHFQTESDAFDIENVSHYSLISPPEAPVTLKQDGK